jgi:hypothetical protein
MLCRAHGLKILHSGCTKDPYYIDRKYTMGELPMFMQYLSGIMTANDDCPDPKPVDAEWMCFEARRNTFSCRVCLALAVIA